MSEAGGTAGGKERSTAGAIPGGPAGEANAYVSRVSFEVAATLLALAGIRSGDYVLDAGCGTGALTFPAAAATGRDGRSVGLDPERGVLDAARGRHPERSGPPLAWVCGSRTTLPFRDGTFDKLLSARAEHDFAEYARVLKPGGRLAVVMTAEIESEALAAVLAVAGLRLLPEAPGDGVIRYVGAMRT